MPELPEVENVSRGLAQLVPAGSILTGFEFRRKDIRFKLPISKLNKFAGAKLVRIYRRAKFIFFETDRGILFSHLGMTGKWRKLSPGELFEKHDHLVLQFSKGVSLVYSDPRRFGFFDCWRGKASDFSDYANHPRLKNMGIEPLSEEFTAEFLEKFFRGKNTPVKSALLDQRGIAGLGNIYVCEALFRVGIRPLRKASRVPPAKWPLLVTEIQKILRAAIEAGGSSIRDYRDAKNQAGSFQDQHLVYGRQGQLCSICHTPIKNTRIAGRSSFWCPTCQS